VEINAYWYSALKIMAALAPDMGESSAEYEELAEKVAVSFQKFWMEEKGYLKDVLSGTAADEQLRCNQIWAITMPFTVLSRAQEKSVVDTVYRHLYTPVGLRTLSPEDPEFHPNYGGSQFDRDLAYHQGTVWPFPLGAYYLAYLKVNDYSDAARENTYRQLESLETALREGCVGQIPEIYEGLTPGASQGCFAQAWSVGELLRVFEALEKGI
jgi:glycogen debranching enzyme